MENDPILHPPSIISAAKWEVYAPEGGFDTGKHSYAHSYSICESDSEDLELRHKCIALVFGDSDEEAIALANFMISKAKGEVPDGR